jgi:dienelactone hydrolase
VDPSLPRHTIFAPTSPPANLKLPVLVWGQSGCTNNGTVFRIFLEELASHGVFIISNGIPNGAANPNGIAETANPNASLHKEGIDWVSKVAGVPGNYSAVDASRIAVAGQSCGGTQAYAIVNKDPRITAIGIFNSGMINATDATPSLVKVPIFFFLGGPTDIAYANVSFYHQVMVAAWVWR